MDDPKDKQPGTHDQLCVPEGDNLAMEAPAGESGNNESDEKTLMTIVGRLKKLIVELKENLIVLNRGIVARQDTIDHLTKRKQKLQEANRDPATEGLSATIIRITDVGLDLMDNDLATDAIDIFPEEIWEVILGNLTDPKNLRNCSKSCQLFDKILHPFKPSFLFLGVFPHLCRYLDNKLILKCRLVCKGWNEGVDSFVENHPALVPSDEASWNPRYPLTTKGLFPLKFSNRMGDLREQNFLGKMRNHSRNPFVGRAVTIRLLWHYLPDNNDDVENAREPDPAAGAANDEDDGFDADEINFDPVAIFRVPDFLPPHEPVGMPLEQQKQFFWRVLIRFLKAFGKHIWYLSFQSDRDDFFVPREAPLFQFRAGRIFTYCPNLRRIQINGHFPTPSRFEFGPIPVLPNLETLHIDKELKYNFFGDGSNSSVGKTLIHSSFQQLKQLHVDWGTWEDTFESNLEWSKLTELYIDKDGVGGAIKAKHLVSTKMPHLQKIGLNCDFRKMIKIINGLSRKTNLCVFRLFGVIERKEVLQAPDCLFAYPNLKTLEMDRAFDYTFLLRFPFLQYLVVFYNKNDYLERSEARLERQVLELESYMFEGRIYECEIWELLPRLKVFTVGRDVYTRECYERIMSRKKKN